MADAPSILFINQHYHPDFASTAQHLTDLAEHLADDGFDVHVLCSRGHYLSGEMDVPAEEIHNGVHVQRVRTTAFGRSSHVGRIADYGSFFVHVLRHLFFGPQYDLVVTLTTPPLVYVAAAVARLVRGQEYAIWSMDLHPEAEEAVRMIAPGGVVARALRSCSRWGYRKAEFVVDLGRYMKKRIRRKGVPAQRLETIPVWNKKDEVKPIPDEENPLYEEHPELRDKFVVMYSGNAGIGHRFDEVLRAMKRLRDDPDIFFLFVGSGPRKEEITTFADTHNLSNFAYLPYFPRDQIKYSLSLADVHLLTLRKRMAGVAVPGKLYGILASGSPVLMVGPEDSEPAHTIERHDVGVVIDPHAEPEPVDAFVEHVQTLQAEDTLRREMGVRGREVFVEHFAKEPVCETWADHLRERLNGEPQQA